MFFYVILHLINKFLPIMTSLLPSLSVWLNSLFNCVNHSWSLILVIVIWFLETLGSIINRNVFYGLFYFCCDVILFYIESPGTPLHTAAKERNRRAIRFLVENGAFLPDNMEDTRFNPPVHYCPGLEWAYDEMKRVQQESGTSSGEGSCSSES